MDTNINTNVSCEVFGLSGEKLFISREHRFTTDSFLLADFAFNKKHKIIVDLCSGCGIIPMILYTKHLEESTLPQIYAVELQEEAVSLMEKTVSRYSEHSENKYTPFTIIGGDLKCIDTLSKIGLGTVDMITANPPYFTDNSGRKRKSPSQRLMRYESLDGNDSGCNLYDVALSASKLLRFGGELKLCMTAARLSECIEAMITNSIQPKEIVLIPRGDTDTARLFLISGKKGGKSGVKIKWKKT